MLRVAAGFIENQKGELLLSLRPEGKSLAGFWELPGGKIEAGESAFAALERELQEELHLDVSLVEEFGVYEFSYPAGPDVALHIFRVRAKTVPKRTAAASEIRWVPPKLAVDLNLAPADVKPLKDYLTRLKICS